MADIRAGSSSKITFTLLDLAGAPVPLAAVTALTLLYMDVATDAVIGPWNNRNVLNVNGGVVVDGGGTITIPAADNAMVSPTAKHESHLAVLKFTTATEAGSGEILIMLTRVHA